jgi:hypothetical protein
MMSYYSGPGSRRWMLDAAAGDDRRSERGVVLANGGSGGGR